MYNTIQDKNNEIKDLEYKNTVNHNKTEELTSTLIELNKELEKSHKQKIAIIDEKEGVQRELNQKLHETHKKINESRNISQSIYSSSKLFTHKFINVIKNESDLFDQKFIDKLQLFEENQINPQEIDITESLKMFNEFINLILNEFEVRINYAFLTYNIII